MIRIVGDPFPEQSALDRLWRDAWGSPCQGYAANVLPRSRCHLGAFADHDLVGFVNVAWDGGVHGFLLDTCVASRFQRQGIATTLVREAVTASRARGLHWLHVDYEPHLQAFYANCGFRPTQAGLVALK